LKGIQFAADGNEIAEICRRWNIQELALFGSALRDDFGADSDIDLGDGLCQLRQRDKQEGFSGSADTLAAYGWDA
jgi:predicted nucleotidyltransferase